VLSRFGFNIINLILYKIHTCYIYWQVLPAEFPVVVREHHNGMYRVLIYYISKIVAFVINLNICITFSKIIINYIVIIFKIPTFSIDGLTFISIAYFMIGRCYHANLRNQETRLKFPQKLTHKFKWNRTPKEREGFSADGADWGAAGAGGKRLRHHALRRDAKVFRGHRRRRTHHDRHRDDGRLVYQHWVKHLFNVDHTWAGAKVWGLKSQKGLRQVQKSLFRP